jgi:hypothetical protein
MGQHGRAADGPNLRREPGWSAGPQGCPADDRDLQPGGPRLRANIEKRIVLIDGSELVNLMIEHDIGVSNEARIEIKRLDNDYFDEE